MLFHMQSPMHYETTSKGYDIPNFLLLLQCSLLPTHPSNAQGYENAERTFPTAVNHHARHNAGAPSSSTIFLAASTKLYNKVCVLDPAIRAHKGESPTPDSPFIRLLLGSQSNHILLHPGPTHSVRQDRPSSSHPAFMLTRYRIRAVRISLDR